jgi:hypothetical protein
MSNNKFTGARPVRFAHGQGWVACLDHQAQRWQPVLADRVLCQPPYKATRKAALDLIRANLLNRQPYGHNYKLGKRMPERSN